jgi:hypothetical protein
MIPVASNHAANIVDRDLLPRLGANMLPARNLLQHKQSNLIASIEEVTRLRIVRRADNVAVKPRTQNIGILALHAGRHRLADKGESLVAIEPTEFDDLAVEREAVIREHRLAETNAA